jgi:hypothetical protein
VTAADGSYSFFGQTIGTTYRVDVLLPPEWQATSPTDLTVSLANSEGAGEYQNDFGAVPAGRTAADSGDNWLAADPAAADSLWSGSNHRERGL